MILQQKGFNVNLKNNTNFLSNNESKLTQINSLSQSFQTNRYYSRRVLVIGLDSAEPSLVFSRWRDKLPTLSKLIERGTWGRMISTIPAITVPAWASMLSSKDPGQLGVYGFHNRVDYTYRSLNIANITSLHEPMLSNILSKAGKNIALIGVPPSYPPQPVNGIVVGCFLSPSTSKNFTWPPNFSAEIKADLGDYLVDVPQFRTKNITEFISNLKLMTNQHFALIKKLLVRQSWDFFMFVEIGVDRAHHALWKFQDSTHPKYMPGNPYEQAILNYYQMLDFHLAEVVKLAGKNTIIWVVSDHGAKTMLGGFCLNEWLIREGYLIIKQKPSKITSLDNCEIDWKRTKIWGSGGYCGRLFFNVKDREPAGIININEYEELRDEIKTKIEKLSDYQGNPMKNQVFKPQKLYRSCQGIPPDLIIYFNELSWRTIGTIGHNHLYIYENDIGPDGANHAQEGLFIHFDPYKNGLGEVEALSIYDLAPGFLQPMGITPPPDMIGKVPTFV